MAMDSSFLTPEAVQTPSGLGQQTREYKSRKRHFVSDTAANDGSVFDIADDTAPMRVDVSLTALIALLEGARQAHDAYAPIDANVPPLLLDPRAAQAVAAYQARIRQARAMQVVPDAQATYEDTTALVKQLQELRSHGVTHLNLERVAGVSLETAVRQALQG